MRDARSSSDAGPVLLMNMTVAGGFPSPADDYIGRALDLNEFLVKHPAATFFVRVHGDSMRDAGIHHGDILVVDRSLEAVNGAVVVAVLDGEFTVKRLRKNNGSVFLQAENAAYPPIAVSSDRNFQIWGVVAFAIHAL